MIEVKGGHEIVITIKGEPKDDAIVVPLDDSILKAAVLSGASGKFKKDQATLNESNSVDFAEISYPDNLAVTVDGVSIPTEEAIGYLGDFIVEAIKSALNNLLEPQ